MFKNKPQNKPAGKKEATKQANKPQAIFTSHRPRKQATFGFKQATLATLACEMKFSLIYILIKRIT